MTKHLPVSDHAVLRYLHQVAGVDVEAIRQRIHDNTHKALAAGASGIISNGISYKFKHGKVASIWISQHHARPLTWPKGGDK